MKTKNKIIVISIIALTFVVVFSLGFAFFNNLASIETMIDDYFPDVFDADSDVISDNVVESGTDSDLAEDSSWTSDDDVITITVEIYKAIFDQSNFSTELYTKLFYNYSKNESYKIDLPDYSSQNYYPNSSMVLEGTCLDNKTVKVIYYPAAADAFIVRGAHNFAVTLNYDLHLNNQFQPIVVRNLTGLDVNTLLFFCTYNGNFLESGFITSDYYIPSDGYIVIFPYDSSSVLANPYNSHILGYYKFNKSFMTRVRDDGFSSFVEQSKMFVESLGDIETEIIPDVSV